jgi:Ca2+-binding EF-hand superfamily protein
MNKLLFASLLGLSLGTSAAWAEHHMGKGDHNSDSDRDMKKYDTNSDGMLSRDEFIRAKTEKFMKMDKNNDGMLDASEQRAMIDYKHKDSKDKDGNKQNRY